MSTLSPAKIKRIRDTKGTSAERHMLYYLNGTLETLANELEKLSNQFDIEGGSIIAKKELVYHQIEHLNLVIKNRNAKKGVA